MIAVLVAIIAVLLLYIVVSRRRPVQQETADEGRAAVNPDVTKTAFLSNVSHDFRTPMNAIIGYANLAMSHLDEKEVVGNYLSKINQASGHLLNLVNDVLDMSRLDAGSIVLYEKPEKVSDMIQALKNQIDADLLQKDVQLDMTVGGIADDVVICDKLRVNQIMMNLLLNAAKYTGEGGSISLEINGVESEREGFKIYTVCVEDYGVGMTKEYVNAIFEPFSIASTSTADNVQGTGLGMFIAKNLVELMGGTIDVQSEPGKGTVVTVVLDMKLEETAPVDEEQVIEAAADFSGKKVLLVEDNELNLEIAKMILEEFGFEITVARDGADAVLKAQSASVGDYDVILMDIQMPLMDGYEATRRIRALGTDISRIPIIAMTANAFEEDRAAALAAGMVDHVAKPIDTEKLVETLTKFLK